MSTELLKKLTKLKSKIDGISKQQIKDSYKIYREGQSILYIKKGAKDITVWYSPHNIFVDEFSTPEFQKYAKDMFKKVEIGYLKMFLQRNELNAYDVFEDGKYKIKPKSRFIICVNMQKNDDELQKGFLIRQNGEIRTKNINLFGQTFKEPTLKSRVGEITSQESKDLNIFLNIIQKYLNDLFSGKIKPLKDDTLDVTPPDIDQEILEELTPLERILREEEEQKNPVIEPEDE